MYLLDTNIISEIRRLKHGKCHANVAAWVQIIPSQLMYTSVVVMMELERGVLAKENKDSVQGAVLRRWLDNIVRTAFLDRVPPIDAKTAQICAGLHIPHHAPEKDAWIAATAFQHNLILVTRNVSDYSYKGLKLFNPFDFNKV